jgi:hypothetical protein
MAAPAPARSAAIQIVRPPDAPAKTETPEKKKSEYDTKAGLRSALALALGGARDLASQTWLSGRQ